MDNPLTDVLPAAARKYFYAALWLAALVFGAFQVADGDWLAVVGALVVALGGGTAQANTPKPEFVEH